MRESGPTGFHGAGGQPGNGGVKTACLSLCATSDAAGLPGKPGTQGISAPGGPGQQNVKCVGGAGGTGGQHGVTGGLGPAGFVGTGIGAGAVNGGGGANMSVNILHPVLGAGGGVHVKIVG